MFSIICIFVLFLFRFSNKQVTKYLTEVLDQYSFTYWSSTELVKTNGPKKGN